MSREHAISAGSPPARASLVRCLAVWSAITALAAAGTMLCVTSALETLAQGPHATPDAAVLLVAALAGALLCPWIWLVATSTVLDHLRGRAVHSTGIVRRLVLAACGVAVTLTAVPAHAQETSAADTVAGTTQVLDGLPFPDRASNSDSPPAATTPPPADAASPSPVATSSSSAQPSDERAAEDLEKASATTPATEAAEVTESAESPASAESLAPTESPASADDAAPAAGRRVAGSASDVHVVQAGDSLWKLAAEHSETTAAHDVQALVTAIHEKNRTVIGTDPDLILPGQELLLPHTETPSSEDEVSR